MGEVSSVRPQKGYQMTALSSPADIVFGGGAAGAGKTFSLLLDPMRYANNPDFGAVIFRRLTTQIRAQGGLWDEANKLYPLAGAKPNKTDLTWTFPAGSKIKFSHLEHEKNVTSWQGSQIPFIGFDELTHFSKDTFFYLLSRNRSVSGVKPCVRATCNPDPDSWVFEMIKWYIGDDGFPAPERQGVVRYFVKDGDAMIWGASVEECLEKAAYFINPLVEASGIEPRHFVKSFTFIGGSVYENRKLLEKNPEYLANLAAQDEESKLQLLDGNWKVSLNPADVYNYNAFKDVFNNHFLLEKYKGDQKKITVDVALGGKDKLIIMVWEGFALIDIKIIDKSTGKDVIDEIEVMQNKHSVPNRFVTYDADAIGGFIGGVNNAFIPDSIAFNNGARQIDMKDGRIFKNLKAQCYILNGERVSKDQIYISPAVANKMYDDKKTVRQQLMEERKAIKKQPKKDEEPLSLIKKEEMKAKYLQGASPDLMDALMQVEIFELDPVQDYQMFY